MTIGIDIGGSNIKGVLLKGNEIIAKVRVLTKSKDSKKILLNQIFGCVDKLIKGKKTIAGIGIGVAGPVDFKNQKVLNPPNVTGLKGLYLGRLIKEKFTPYLKRGARVIIDNDVHCLVLAEAILGAGRGKNLVVGLGLGTGVGGGIVLNKKILYGAGGTAGEIGHTIIKKDGRGCTCGSKGCLEAYISERGIKETAKEIFAKEIDTIILYKMAKKGDKKAIKVWEITGRYLGTSLANIVDDLNPDVIVIGGGIAGAGEFLLKSARKEMRDNVLSPLAKKTPIVRAKLGKFAGAIGAGLL